MLSVRIARADDADAAIQVLRKSITELCVRDHQNDAPTLERWLRNKTPERYGALIADPENLLMVAESENPNPTNCPQNESTAYLTPSPRPASSSERTPTTEEWTLSPLTRDSTLPTR